MTPTPNQLFERFFITLEPVCCYYESRHTNVVSACLENKNALADFWRLTPEGPFPWEKTE
jgi:hypothetical protein